MASLPGVTYRFSTADDLDAIQRILGSQVDYIVADYVRFYDKPWFFGCVAELDGEVIGFSAVTVLMEGTTIYVRGSRVKEAYRNHGIYGQIIKFLRTAVKAAGHPDLRVEEFTTHDTNPSLHKLIRSPAYKKIHERAFVIYELTEKSRSVINGSGSSHPTTEEIGIEGLRDILQKETVCRSLFPVRVFAGIFGFQPYPSELEIMAQYQPLIVASSGENKTDVSQMTIGMWVAAKCYMIQWMLPSGSDPSVVSKGFHKNMEKQLKRMIQVSDGVWCRIEFDKAFKPVVESVAAAYGLSPVKPYAESAIGFRREF